MCTLRDSRANPPVKIKFTSKPWKVTPFQHAHQVSHDTAGADYEFNSDDMKGKGCGSYVLTYIPAKDGDQPKRDGTDHFAYGKCLPLPLPLTRRRPDPLRGHDQGQGGRHHDP